MKSQVLTIEQMQELEALGVDISKASMCWFKSTVSNYGKFSDYWTIMPRPKVGEYEIILTFTLQDIIDLIVSWAEYDFCVAHNKAFLFDLSDSDTTVPFHMEVGKTTIEAAFNMLKWCKQNES